MSIREGKFGEHKDLLPKDHPFAKIPAERDVFIGEYAAGDKITSANPQDVVHDAWDGVGVLVSGIAEVCDEEVTQKTYVLRRGRVRAADYKVTAFRPIRLINPGEYIGLFGYIEKRTQSQLPSKRSPRGEETWSVYSGRRSHVLRSQDFSSYPEERLKPFLESQVLCPQKWSRRVSQVHSDTKILFFSPESIGSAKEKPRGKRLVVGGSEEHASCLYTTLLEAAWRDSAPYRLGLNANNQQGFLDFLNAQVRVRKAASGGDVDKDLARAFASATFDAIDRVFRGEPLFVKYGDVHSAPDGAPTDEPLSSTLIAFNFDKDRKIDYYMPYDMANPLVAKCLAELTADYKENPTGNNAGQNYRLFNDWHQSANIAKYVKFGNACLAELAKSRTIDGFNCSVVCDRVFDAMFIKITPAGK